MDGATSTSLARLRLSAAATASTGLSSAVVVSGWTTETGLGAPAYWPWLLTGLQVLALWAASGDRWWGWLTGAAVQPPWIAYALVTGQFGFVPGCLVSAVVQTFGFLRWRETAGEPIRGRTARPCLEQEVIA